MTEVTQRDRDRANELGQKLGTLAQDYETFGERRTQAQMEAFNEACLKVTEQLFAEHREESIRAIAGK